MLLQDGCDFMDDQKISVFDVYVATHCLQHCCCTPTCLFPMRGVILCVGHLCFGSTQSCYSSAPAVKTETIELVDLTRPTRSLLQCKGQKQELKIDLTTLNKLILSQQQIQHCVTNCADNSTSVSVKHTNLHFEVYIISLVSFFTSKRDYIEIFNRCETKYNR